MTHRAQESTVAADTSIITPPTHAEAATKLTERGLHEAFNLYNYKPREEAESGKAKASEVRKDKSWLDKSFKLHMQQGSSTPHILGRDFVRGTRDSIFHRQPPS
jgi:hypothetical protein